MAKRESCRICRVFYGSSPAAQRELKLHEERHVTRAKRVGFLVEARGMAKKWKTRS